jgi:hypothetical protein
VTSSDPARSAAPAQSCGHARTWAGVSQTPYAHGRRRLVCPARSHQGLGLASQVALERTLTALLVKSAVAYLLTFYSS